MVKHYAKRVGVNIEGFGAHSLRATAATNQYIRLGAHFHF
jgi:integrase